MPSQDIGSVPHQVGNCVTCVGQSPACVWGPELRAQRSARDSRRAFSHALPVRAVDGRVHAYTDRERERERDGGRGRGGYTAAETVNESVTDSH